MNIVKLTCVDIELEDNSSISLTGLLLQLDIHKHMYKLTYGNNLLFRVRVSSDDGYYLLYLEVFAKRDSKEHLAWLEEKGYIHERQEELRKARQQENDKLEQELYKKLHEKWGKA